MTRPRRDTHYPPARSSLLPAAIAALVVAAVLGLALLSGCVDPGYPDSVTCYAGATVVFHADHANAWQYRSEWVITTPDGKQREFQSGCTSESAAKPTPVGCHANGEPHPRDWCRAHGVKP